MAEPVDIILLSYNRLDYLIEMVAALEEHTRWPHRLTIVDNASGASTRQWLRDNIGRFHQVIWNARNEHLAGFQHGIAATSGEFFVMSDADLIVRAPVDGRCWLQQLLELADRHPDFGLIGARLDSLSEARNARLELAPLVDGELFETPTGVWLNLMRRSALRVPYVSDGITCHALRRSGFRVGIAANVLVRHLGDCDPQRHPDYLARKQGASGWGTTYPDYKELSEAAPVPTLSELALAAPVLDAIERLGIGTEALLELRTPDAAAVLPLAAPSIACASVVDPAPVSARAVALLAPGGATAASLERGFEAAAEWLILLAPAAIPAAAEGWVLKDERPGPHPAALRLAAVASRRRWLHALGYSALEHRDQWLAVFRAACFGDDPQLRLYVFQRTNPLAPSERRGGSVTAADAADARRRSVRVRRRKIGALATKARRLVWAELELRRCGNR